MGCENNNLDDVWQRWCSQFAIWRQASVCLRGGSPTVPDVYVVLDRSGALALSSDSRPPTQRWANSRPVLGSVGMAGRKNATKAPGRDPTLPENDAPSDRHGQHQKVTTMVPRISKSAQYGAKQLASPGHRSASICRTRSKNGPPQVATRFGVARRYAKQHNDFCSGGHGARTRNPLRGTTFPVCSGVDVKL